MRTNRTTIFLVPLALALFVFASRFPAYAQPPSQDNRQALVISVTRFGFQPAHITLPKGQVYISIENRSRVPQVTLHLDDDAAPGSHLKEVILHQRGPDHIDFYNLKPGSYTLSEPDHPKWTCKITVVK